MRARLQWGGSRGRGLWPLALQHCPWGAAGGVGGDSKCQALAFTPASSQGCRRVLSRQAPASKEGFQGC